jgi:FKBP-type peptidyl-prolyl cis-trans isomerase
MTPMTTASAVNTTDKFTTSSKPIQLRYRGITYWYDPNQRAKKQNLQTLNKNHKGNQSYTLIYRGNQYVVDSAAYPAQPTRGDQTVTLHYRGNCYQVQRAI